MEFIGENDFFVLEKPTGQVKRITDGGAPTVVLDLTVNSNSERGLLGIALDKYFRHNGFVYLYWSETTLPADNTAGDAVPVLGNRLDRFKWNGTTLTFDKTLHRRCARSRTTSRTGRTRQSGVRGNHNGGVVRVGPGRQDLPDRRRHRPPRPDAEPGRRAVRLPVPDGRVPTASIDDDQFGGPDPDAGTSPA